MKSTITAAGIEFNISAKCIAQGVAFPFEKNDKPYHNKFRVSVSTEYGRTSFVFFGSEADYRNNITTLDESALKNALYCLFSDACSAENSFANFCSELGYEEDSRTAERIYKTCKKQFEKADKIAGANIYDIANALND